MRGADIAVRAVGRLVAIATGAACASIGSVIPAWRGALIVAHADIVDRFNHTYEHAAATAARFGDQVRSAAHTGLVQSVATRSAAAASALLVLHVITKGAIALQLIQLVPAAASIFAWGTSPWLAVAGVVGGTVASMAYSLWAMSRVSLDELDMTIEVAADGSITVSGIPGDIPEAVALTLAEEAGSKAAHDHHLAAAPGATHRSARRSSATSTRRK
jgi:hypothetical protein